MNIKDNLTDGMSNVTNYIAYSIVGAFLIIVLIGMASMYINCEGVLVRTMFGYECMEEK